MTKEEAIRSLCLLDKSPTGELYLDINFGEEEVNYVMEAAIEYTDGVFPSCLFCDNLITKITMRCRQNTVCERLDDILRYSFDKDKLRQIAHS